MDKNYVDLSGTPDKTAGTTRTLVRITVHLSSLLMASPYSAIKGEEEG
ncbi:hypothetical protein LRH25_12550 [Ideonella azotifigens]|uniref:Uncharacterized protein n=1 Tax=Ideonella azotifigens TaxID=513160 RepID=A0ABN1JUR8_9BURK|nr:hypothetical protein [Ideonella azotifigens]MCD2341173.1 hypothetical protein [Ideonella azotifigens]